MPLVGFSVGPAAAEFLDEMQPGKLRAQIAKRMKSLATNANPAGCKKLNGVTFDGVPVLRVRSGDYRILYVVKPDEVLVIDIGHRKDIYR